MTANRIVTPALARKCHREYVAGKGSMRAIAKRHRVSEEALRKERKRLGLPVLLPRGGGGQRRFVPESADTTRWNALIEPGWRVHGEVMA